MDSVLCSPGQGLRLAHAGHTVQNVNMGGKVVKFGPESVCVVSSRWYNVVVWRLWMVWHIKVLLFVWFSRSFQYTLLLSHSQDFLYTHLSCLHYIYNTWPLLYLHYQPYNSILPLTISPIYPIDSIISPLYNFGHQPYPLQPGEGGLPTGPSIGHVPKAYAVSETSSDIVVYMSLQHTITTTPSFVLALDTYIWNLITTCTTLDLLLYLHYQPYNSILPLTIHPIYPIDSIISPLYNFSHQPYLLQSGEGGLSTGPSIGHVPKAYAVSETSSDIVVYMSLQHTITTTPSFVLALDTYIWNLITTCTTLDLLLYLHYQPYNSILPLTIHPIYPIDSIISPLYNFSHQPYLLQPREGGLSTGLSIGHVPVSSASEAYAVSKISSALQTVTLLFTCPTQATHVSPAHHNHHPVFCFGI